MRNKWLMVMGLILAAGLIGLVGCQPATAALGEITELSLSTQQQGIWVNGQGKIAAEPDLATLRLGIDAEAQSVAVAQADAAGAMERVMNALEDAGIDDKDIQTQSFSIRRMTRWDRDTEKEVTTGYRVSNIVAAKVRNIDETGAIIDAVAAAGGDLTRIDSINFSVEDPTDYNKTAREKAMADALAKAQQLADLAGVSLGEPTFVSESSSSPSPVFRSGGFDMEMAAASIADTSISPGELEISINLQLVYAIK